MDQDEELENLLKEIQSKIIEWDEKRSRKRKIKYLFDVKVHLIPLELYNQHMGDISDESISDFECLNYIEEEKALIDDVCKKLIGD